MKHPCIYRPGYNRIPMLSTYDSITGTIERVPTEFFKIDYNEFGTTNDQSTVSMNSETVSSLYRELDSNFGPMAYYCSNYSSICIVGDQVIDNFLNRIGRVQGRTGFIKGSVIGILYYQPLMVDYTIDNVYLMEYQTSDGKKWWYLPSGFYEAPMSGYSANPHGCLLPHANSIVRSGNTDGYLGVCHLNGVPVNIKLEEGRITLHGN